ncbi:uncharacterized protein LOC142168152 [Nicotiana tabacum]|uniref:Uncharacterized protein LOC142168152 n=1 Tax=Nicotiana tabacum TaxID=4097 RepID=A0AC58SIY3_TOBAC
MDAQFIHCTITSSNVSCALAVVYGYNCLEMRKEIWQKLKNLAQTLNQPWLLWGDFNAIINPQDRVSKHGVTQVEVQDFANFCSDAMMSELPCRGEFFTWKYGQMGEDVVINRIDRALGNDDWMLNLGHLTIEVGDPFILDHTLLMLKFQRRNNNIKVPFRFLNVWTEYEEFQRIVTEGWHGTQHSCKLATIWYMLKAMKYEF